MIRRKMKLYVTILAAVLLLLTGCNGKSTTTAKKVLPEGPFGPYKETVTVSVGQTVRPTLTFPEGQSPTDNVMLDDIKNTLNIDIDWKWQVSESDEADKINLAIASNDLPDIMVVDIIQLRELIKNEQIQELTDVIDNFASPAAKGILNVNNGEPLKFTTFNDKIMAIPQIATQDDGYTPMWIRQDWLDNLELEMPTTIAELRDVALKFATLDPDGDGVDGNTKGILGAQSNSKLFTSFLNPNNNFYNFDPVASAHGAFPGYWVKDDSGKLVYGSTTKETRDTLETLAAMYANGEIDPGLGTRDNVHEDIVGGKAGIYFGQWWSGYWPLPDAFKADPNANWVSVGAPLNENGEWILRGGKTFPKFLVVRKGFEYPEAAMLLANLTLREENTYTGEHANPISYFPARIVLASLDEQPVHRSYLKRIVEQGETVVKDDIKENTDQYKLLINDIETIGEAFTGNFEDGGYHPKNWDLEHPNFPRFYSVMVGAAPFYENPPKEIVHSEVYQVVTKTMKQKWSNLEKMEDEIFLKIILGQKDIAEFDKFVTDWYAQGGQEITAEMNEE